MHGVSYELDAEPSTHSDASHSAPLATHTTKATAAADTQPVTAPIPSQPILNTTVLAQSYSTSDAWNEHASIESSSEASRRMCTGAQRHSDGHTVPTGSLKMGLLSSQLRGAKDKNPLVDVHSPRSVPTTSGRMTQGTHHPSLEQFPNTSGRDKMPMSSSLTFQSPLQRVASGSLASVAANIHSSFGERSRDDVQVEVTDHTVASSTSSTAQGAPVPCRLLENGSVDILARESAPSSFQTSGSIDRVVSHDMNKLLGLGSDRLERTSSSAAAGAGGRPGFSSGRTRSMSMRGLQVQTQGGGAVAAGRSESGSSPLGCNLADLQEETAEPGISERAVHLLSQGDAVGVFLLFGLF